MKYPIVLLPRNLKNIKNNIIEHPLSLKNPEKPNKGEKNYKSWTLIFISLILNIMGASSNSDEVIILAFLLLLIALIWRFLESINNKNAEELYLKLLSEYQGELNLYLKREGEIKYIQRVINDPLQKEQYLIVQKEMFLNNILMPNLFVPTKKGITENYFTQFLIRYFPDEVSTGLTINQVNSKIHPYVPDFVIYSSSERFCIDIEIDEPYSIDKRVPIHYLINENQTCDFIRDQFFLESNWIVIRFSEEQIIRSPIGCCYYIALIISFYFGLNKYKIRFNKIPSLKSTDTWSHSDSIRKSKELFRENLLLEIGITVKPPHEIKAETLIPREDDLPF